MSVFNKAGVEFKHLVRVNRDPNVDPTYSHKFPTLVGNKVVERWGTHVRPIRSLTHALRGVRLMRNKDYVIEYSAALQQYEYWFLEGQMATLFALVCGSMLQTQSPKGHRFDIVCPHCQQQFDTQQITWI